MMGARNGGFGVLIGTAVGTLFLVPAHGSAQAEVFRQDPCSSAVVYTSAFAALIGCAAEGYAPDQYTLGWMYTNGIDVQENDVEAVRWFRMAAEQGHPGAQHDLGLMYAEGDGVPEDDAEAVRWYLLAAAQAYVPAQGNLGDLQDLVVVAESFLEAAGFLENLTQPQMRLLEARIDPNGL